jgi:hypothetical protein
MALTEAHERYKWLVEEEERIILKLEACELSKSTLFDMVYRCEQEPDPATVEEILRAVHAIDQRLQSELLELRLEKKSLARKMKTHT